MPVTPTVAAMPHLCSSSTWGGGKDEDDDEEEEEAIPTSSLVAAVAIHSMHAVCPPSAAKWVQLKPSLVSLEGDKDCAIAAAVAGVEKEDAAVLVIHCRKES